jgi:hypothetical protein
MLLQKTLNSPQPAKGEKEYQSLGFKILGINTGLQ